MVIQKVFAVYFSPTDTTKSIVTHLASAAAEKLSAACTELDFTLPEARENPVIFSPSDLVIFGVPVYAGRVPNVLLPYLTKMVGGGGALAVPVVLYGNRNFDDALIELRNILETRGFHTVAGGAFIGEHSFSRVLAAHRPDEKDFAACKRFTQLFCERVKNMDQPPAEPAAVKGQTPVRPYYTPQDRQGNPVNILRVKPKVNENCNQCGLCAELCPMGSIDPKSITSYTGICIKCGACIKKCPRAARYYDDPNYLYHQHELEEEFTRRAEPEFF